MGSVATDFIIHLPKTVRGYDAITKFVDRFSKRVHFILSRTTDTAFDAATGFYETVIRQHGLPDNIVSDRDQKFTRTFYLEFMKNTYHVTVIKQLSYSN